MKPCLASSELFIELREKQLKRERERERDLTGRLVEITRISEAGHALRLSKQYMSTCLIIWLSGRYTHPRL